MRLTLPTGGRVLLREPGRRVAETVHALLDEGAVVDVHTDPTEAQGALADLASRRLVTLVAEPDLAAYDVVLRDPQGEGMATAAPVDQGAGRVILVGGGPGDPGLLTVAGLAALRAADVVVCDRLAPLGLLSELDPAVEIIHVGKIPRGAFTPQEQINAILLDRAGAGHTVVRLKGGDSFVFGRGGEEWNACVEAGIAVTVIPGVTSAIAAPALAGIPVTHRELAQGFVVVSGHVGPDDPRNAVDWSAIARTGLTVVILMGVATLPEIAEELVANGLDPVTPAACVADAGMPSQQVVWAALTDLAGSVTAAGLRPPSVTVIGPAVGALTDPER